MPFWQAYPSVKPQDALPEYDYIVVGGGTAGCVLASRLSEDTNATVLLLERGKVVDNWLSRCPLTSLFYATTSVAYRWASAPLTYNRNEQYEMVTGKGLGGSSLINGMLYTRGTPAEFDAWKQTGWSYDELLPLFLKSEGAVGEVASRKHCHGTTGPWKVRLRDQFYFDSYPWTIKAGAAIGLPLIHDPNDPAEPVAGCARLSCTLTESGTRCSTFSAFLPHTVAVSRKGRLTICTETVVSKIDFQVEKGRPKAIGVFFEPESGKGTHYARARREIILASGPFGSPQLLMLSGIGPKKHLTEQGIDVIHDLPGVGSHLQDHIAVSTEYGVPLQQSMNRLIVSTWLVLCELFKYLLYGTGLFLSPITLISVYAISSLLNENSETIVPNPEAVDARKAWPDIELMTLPSHASEKRPPPRQGMMGYIVTLLQPKSRGTVRLRSSDPRDRPLCELGFLSAPEDMLVLRKGVRLAMRFGQEMRAQGKPVQDYTIPKPGTSDDEVDAFIKAEARTVYHYSSTCRMASVEDDGVVNVELKVYGVDGLRVADSSIFPNILANHLQAATVVVAEKCVEMIKNES